MQRLTAIILLLLTVLLSTCSHVYSQESNSLPSEAIQLEADYWELDRKTGDTLLKGNVRITSGSVRLFCDRARANTQTKQATAEGNVILRKGYKEWRSEQLDYNFATGAMKAGLARADLGGGVFFESKYLEATDKSSYILKDAYFTTSDYEKPGYRLKSSTIIVYPDNRLSLRNVVLYVGSVPVFYFPYLVIPLDEDIYGENTGTQVQIGSKGNWGFFILNSYTTRVSDGLRPTYRLDYRQDRGLAGGIDLRYKAGYPEDRKQAPDSYPRVSGKIRTYYADDDKMRESGPVEVVTSTTTTTQKIKPQRYQIRVSQRAEITEDIYTKLKLNKLSDINFLEDFFEKEFQQDPQPDNFLEITKWSPNTTLSLLARPQVNEFYTTTERLPEVHFDLKRQNIFGSPLFYESENSVSYLSKEFSNLSGARDYHTTRVDTFQQILYPKQYFGWLNFTPRIGGRATFYDRSQLTAYEPSVVRGTFNTGFEASFKASRTWKNVSDKKWEIDGLRHVIEPSVNYGFTARPNYRPDQLYRFDVDRSSFGIDRNLVPINFPQYTGVDSINRRNVVRPALRQRLQTKRDGASWDLAEVLLYQDILLETDPDEKNFSDLFAEVSARPVRWLSLDWRGRYDWYDERLRESTAGMTLLRNKDWSLGLSHSYFRGVGNQAGVSFAWRLNENWALRTEHRLDPTTGTLFEQAYSIDRDLHSWIATLSLSEVRPQNQESDFRVWLSFTLKAFPEVTVDSQQFGAK